MSEKLIVFLSALASGVAVLAVLVSVAFLLGTMQSKIGANEKFIGVLSKDVRKLQDDWIRDIEVNSHKEFGGKTQ